jgi:phosphopantetheine--protein transferase-like protein
MDTAELLRTTVAEFLKTDPAQLQPGSPLAGRRLDSSLGRAALDAAIRRRLKLHCPAVYSAKTYGDLEAAILGKESPNGAVPAPKLASTNGVAVTPSALPLACGIDLEPVANFPAAGDYWEDEFYRSNFTATEIAYCLLQQRPPMHFAARWCAKEALKKCDSRFLQQPMSDLEVAFDEAGVPALNFLKGDTKQRLPFAVSLAHTSDLAIAVVVRQTPPTQAVAAAPAVVAQGPAKEPRGRGLAAVACLLGLISLALAVWALWRTF